MLAGTLVPGEVLGACEGSLAVRTSELGFRVIPPSAAGKHTRGEIRAVAQKMEICLVVRHREGQRRHDSLADCTCDSIQLLPGLVLLFALKLITISPYTAIGSCAMQGSGVQS